jgi:hypothetical protein
MMDRLAAARFAGDAQSVALVEAKIHAVDGPHSAPGRFEIGAEIFDLQDLSHK